MLEKRKTSKNTNNMSSPLAALYKDPTFTANTPPTEDTKTMLPAPEAFRRG